MQYDELPGADESDNPDLGDLIVENHIRGGPYPYPTGNVTDGWLPLCLLWLAGAAAVTSAVVTVVLPQHTPV
jgi:hypothetical protein